jgi:hypothetical protein
MEWLALSNTLMSGADARFTFDKRCSSRFLRFGILICILHAAATVFSVNLPKAEPLDTTADKGILGEQRMNRLSTAPTEKGGLGLEKFFDPTQSKVALEGRTGGTGFDGVFRERGPRGVRYVVGESKYGQSELGEFWTDVYDEKGLLTGKRARYFQGSREWVENVLRRMRSGSAHDQAVAKELTNALNEGRVDFMLFNTKAGGQTGTLEKGPLEPGVTTPRESYRGTAATWRMEEGEPGIAKMKFGKVGCSECNIGSRLAKEAAKIKINNDPKYAPLAEVIDENVNPYTLVPTEEAFDPEFKVNRAKGFSGGTKLQGALPAENQQQVLERVTQRANAHVEGEVTKALLDRQQHWQTLSEEGRLKIKRARSLYDELKGNARGLETLHTLMRAAMFAQFAWSYYEGGPEGLFYAFGNMLYENAKVELMQGLAVWALEDIAARQGPMAVAARNVIPVVESGNLLLIWSAAELSYNLGNWFAVSVILSEEYDAQARLAALGFVQYVNKVDLSQLGTDNLPRINFNNLCTYYISKQQLLERLDRYEQQVFPKGLFDSILNLYRVSQWTQARDSLVHSWMECMTREVVGQFFAIHNFTPGDFCAKISSLETMLAGLGNVRQTREMQQSLVIDEADWQLIVNSTSGLYDKCRKSLDAQLLRKVSTNMNLASDLGALEQQIAEKPNATAFLLFNPDNGSQWSGARGNAVSISTTAVLFGLPGTRTSLRLSSYVQNALGTRKQLRDETRTFDFNVEAYGPDELTELVNLKEDIVRDPQLGDGPYTHRVELYDGQQLVDSRNISINWGPTAGRGIHVISGTYGGNCKDRLNGGKDNTPDKTAHLRAACEGKDVCDYSVVWQAIGDPAYGCKKDYVAVWQCAGGQGSGGTARAEPEAGYGSKVVLSCN